MKTCWRFLIALILFACEGSGSEAAPPAQSAKREGPPTVEVVTVESFKLETTIRLPGELQAYEMVALHPRVSAFVEDVVVDRGSKVKKGQLLARLSAPELVAQRAEAESKLIGSRSTSDRLKSASDTPGVVAKHDLEIADAAVKVDEARVDALKAQEGYLLVRAPFEGIITERSVHPGALVGPSSGPVLRIEVVERLRLVVGVPELDAGAIAEGATVEFVVRTWPGERFQGTIARLARSIEAKTRTMPVELDVDNKSGRLAPGMFAELIWPVRRSGVSMFVPPTAIVQTTERTYVDRVKNGVLEQVIVERGAALGDKTEIFGALEAGDVVLRRGSEEMKPGTPVAPKVDKK